jgi:two-component system, NtrC family, sensor kinase
MVLRFLRNSLRISILAQLAFLILAAMLLISVVMLKLQEQAFIHEKLRRGRLLTQALSLGFMEARIAAAGTQRGNPAELPGKEEMVRLIRTAGFSGAAMMDRQGAVSLAFGPPGETAKKGIAQARQALVTGKEVTRFSGQVWGVLWLASESAIMSAPLFDGQRLAGSIAVWSSLRSVYEEIRRSEKLILVYVLLNTLVLICVGTYLLSRSVVNPVHKLLHITEAFRKGESLPLFPEVSENEMGQLNRSLKMMLNRLEKNKEELQAHIASLEKANEEIRKTQAELIKSEKLASVGRLATGIAHEIGNPIGIILGYMELLKRDDLSSPERWDFLDRVETEITRINGIIRQLLDFSRPAGGEPGETSVHEVLFATLKMLEPQPLMAGIERETRFDAQRDVVWADPNQLQQVFLNIIMNAADAMEKKKSLTIRTFNIQRTLRIQFQDTGIGIPEEDLAGIFDPFYTTKPPGKGTGLGLSVSYTIIKELGGTIRAQNNRGPGATITLDIPVYQGKNDKDCSESNAGGED